VKASRLPSFLPSFLLLITATLLLFGCKKEQEATSNPKQETPVLLKDSEDLVQVTDGVLCFLDMPTFDYYLNSLLAMPDSLRKLQEDQWGFTSYASIADSLSEIIIDASTENEMLQLISSFNDFVKVEDSTLTTQLPFMGHQCVANAGGIFKVDSTYFRIFPEGIVGWFGATLTQIESLTLNEDFDDDLSDGKFFYIRNVELDPLESNCGNVKTVVKYNASQNRRVNFSISVSIAQDPTTTRCPSTNQIMNYRKYCSIVNLYGEKKTLGIWFKYKTYLEFKEVYCELDVPRQNGYNYQTCTTVVGYESRGLINKSDNVSNSKLMTRVYFGMTHNMGDIIHNYQITNPVFTKVKGKATSTGLGGLWGEISCGY